MDYKSLRIVFLGTPDFAVASLQKLVEAGCRIVGVITAPDRPAGRGMKMQQSAVKDYALSQNLKVLQPDKLKSPDFVEELRTLNADLQCVVAFRMLPEIVWNMPKLGTINVHGSLLPQYRGAAPINHAIINGEKKSGVTTFKLKHEIDTGDILLQRETAIGEEETAGELYDRLKVIGADLLLQTVQQLAAGTLKEQPQSFSGLLHHAPKLSTDSARVDPAKTAGEVVNHIRGFAPVPGAWIEFEGKKLKIFRARVTDQNSNPNAGVVEANAALGMHINASDKKVDLLEIQPEGKKRMHAADFLRGRRN